jgi:hypothetical protein
MRGGSNTAYEDVVSITLGDNSFTGVVVLEVLEEIYRLLATIEHNAHLVAIVEDYLSLKLSDSIDKSSS